MRLVDLREEIHDAYENAMQMVKREDEMLVSYGTRHATRLLLEELGKVYMSCTQDEQPLREMYGNLIMGIAVDWRDVYERNCNRDFEDSWQDDPRAQPVLTLESLAAALLLS